MPSYGGKVIIGSKTLANCTSCADYKLFVKGGIKTEKVKVEIAADNGWADYVFNKNYNLMPLKEVEHFINELVQTFRTTRAQAKKCQFNQQISSLSNLTSRVLKLSIQAKHLSITNLLL